jgi:hypothetical protein
VSERDASVCAINVLVPYRSGFVKKKSMAWQLLNQPVEGTEDDGSKTSGNTWA